MLEFFKKKNASMVDSQTGHAKTGLLGRLKTGLLKTRLAFTEGLQSLFLGKKAIDEDLLESLEAFLLSADIGVIPTQEIMRALTNQLSRAALKDPQALLDALKILLQNILLDCEVPLQIPSEITPFVILTVGVNGAGKTTTIGKLTKQLHALNKTVMLAAGDTYRAAAIEQLKVWGERNQVPVIAQQQGADSASVIFDAFQAAKAKKIDVLIADTAGRLHTQDTLVAELQKIVRVLRKVDESAPHEILLVLDAGVGQNALLQVKAFHAALNITGIALTKLDGTAKGGTLFNVAKTLKIPIRFLGFGENIDELQVFQAEAFVKALFSE